MGRLPLSAPAPAACHPEGRAFCGPKDLCNLLTLRHCRQIARVLRFAQDDKVYLGSRFEGWGRACTGGRQIKMPRMNIETPDAPGLPAAYAHVLKP